MSKVTITHTPLEDEVSHIPMGQVCNLAVEGFGDVAVFCATEVADETPVDTLTFDASLFAGEALIRGVTAYNSGYMADSNRYKAPYSFNCASFVFSVANIDLEDPFGDIVGTRQLELIETDSEDLVLPVDTSSIKFGFLASKKSNVVDLPLASGHWFTQLPDKNGTILHTLGSKSPLVLTAAGRLRQMYTKHNLYEAIPKIKTLTN